MTIGILATRYAKALYSFAVDTKEQERVYKEMKYLHYQFLNVHDFKLGIASPSVRIADKLKMLITATSIDGEVCASTKRFFDFVIEKGQTEYLLYMVTSYLTVYRRENNIISVKLVSAEELEEDTIDKVKKLATHGYDKNVQIELETRIQPKLIGGFKLTIDDRQLDASVVGELSRLKKTLMA